MLLWGHVEISFNLETELISSFSFYFFFLCLIGGHWSWIKALNQFIPPTIVFIFYLSRFRTPKIVRVVNQLACIFHQSDNVESYFS